jgi:hypothetical protein
MSDAACRQGWLAALGLVLLSACTETETVGPGPESLLDYASLCSELIAPVPAFDCSTGIEALITVNGLQVPAELAFTPGMGCDRPALLPYGEDSDWQCVPGSMALLLADNEQVQISAFCRKKYHRSGPEETHLFDEIDIIAHAPGSGATCWFHAEGESREQPLDGRRVPPPDEAAPPAGQLAAQDFWWPPQRTAGMNCGGCHDNDPFYYSPYIAQTGQLPANPFGRYDFYIGSAFNAWPPPRSMEIRGNTCMGCHRIGASFTCGEGSLQALGAAHSPGLDAWAKQWPQSHWMPVEQDMSEAQWQVHYARSVQDIQACCQASNQQQPLPENCAITPIQP